MGWLDGWQYRKAITYSSSTTGDIVKRIKLDSNNFDFSKSNGVDLRITSSDGSTVLPTWLERYDADNQIAYIWVRFNKDSDQVTLYLYYGNENADAYDDRSNLFDVFVVFNFDPNGNSDYSCKNVVYDSTNQYVTVGLGNKDNSSGGLTYLSLSDKIVDYNRVGSIIQYNPLGIKGLSEGRSDGHTLSCDDGYVRYYWSNYASPRYKLWKVVDSSTTDYVTDSTSLNYSNRWYYDILEYDYNNKKLVHITSEGWYKELSISNTTVLQISYVGWSTWQGKFALKWFGVFPTDLSSFTIEFGSEETAPTGTTEVQELSDSISSVEGVQFVIGAHSSENIGAIGSIGGQPTQFLKSSNSLVDVEKLLLSVVRASNITVSDVPSVIQKLVQLVASGMVLNSADLSRAIAVAVGNLSTVDTSRLLLGVEDNAKLSLADGGNEDIINALLSNIGLLSSSDLRIIVNNVDMSGLLAKITFAILAGISTNVLLSDVVDVGGAIVELVSIASGLMLSSVSDVNVRARLNNLVLINDAIKSTLSSGINDYVSLSALLQLVARLNENLVDIIQSVESSKMLVTVENVDDVSALVSAVVNVYSLLLDKLLPDDDIKSILQAIVKYLDGIALGDAIDYGKFVEILYSVHFATEVLKVYVTMLLLASNEQFVTNVLKQYLADTDVLVEFVAKSDVLRKYVVGGVRWQSV